ncbi:hypothetical protein OG792_05650 [Micromonospora sp. NBC_01699]|uniref:hypothetical protein n=1 Tax=Micromonospora sp. NBC_01699 TaxID=2975984 RepID=UPI002E2F2AD9|nr:hypothetical protein [Micromonospora sp. NBC_01699]
MSDALLFVNMLCSRSSQPSVIRFVRQEQGYVAVGASRQRPGSVIPGEDGTTHASFGVAEGYTGCPHCGAASFVRCGRCRKLGCWDESWEAFHCRRCGNSGPVDGVIDSLPGPGSD